MLEHAALAAPQVEQWVLIGHSMGGLVARRAHEIAATEALRWAQHTPMIVCLGSPHQGAALEKLGHALSVALDATEVTKPLARVANARSRGVKDMRRGLKGSATPSAAPLALRLIFATLGDASNSVIGPLLGQVFGDGLVRARSAADDGLTGDVQRVELAGLGHMGLLNHPRVYAEIRRWLGAADIIEG